MEDTIYRITGTFSELQELLQSQFAMEEKAARFSVCLLIMEQQQIVDELSETYAALWYLNRNEHFATPVFKSRFSISLTDVKKNILDQIYIQFGGILIEGDALTFTTILSCLLAIYRSGTFIKKEECCVYYQALSWKATHASQEYFHVKDILPSVPEGVCRNLDLIEEGKWKCYSCHGENCSATAESFSAILNELCERNVLKEYNNMYQFVK